MTSTRNEYIAKAKENLDLLNARILELEAKAKEKKGEARREMKAKLSWIRESKEQAQRQLQELKMASEPAWEDVKQGADQAYKSLSEAIERASKRFQ